MHGAYLTKRLAAAVLLTVALPSAPAHPVAPRADQPFATITVEKRLPYSGGTELATDGRYVYAGQWSGRVERYELPRQGGVRILDTTFSPPKLVGTVKCAGSDNDVAVPHPGLLVIAHHRSSCGVRGNGVTTFDVSNPAKPRKLGSLDVWSAHTLTAVPGTDLVYVSPGGLQNGAGLTTIVSVADPRHPRAVGYVQESIWGCHDVTFSTAPAGRLIGVCTGGDGIRIWDLDEPLHPKLLTYIDNKAQGIQFAHGSAISPDGGLLVVNDEAYKSHDCSANRRNDNGSLHLYDITVPALPRYLGHIAPPRGARPRSGEHADTWCTSHQLNFAPNSRRLVNAWFTGGVSVWDLAVPTQPREVAHYMPKDAVVWTAHWINGRIWVNDMVRGLEVLRLGELPVNPPVAETWVAAGTAPVPVVFDEDEPFTPYACPYAGA